jgi:hypothetical protein
LPAPPTGALEAIDRFTGELGNGSNELGPVSCVADLLGDPRPEIIAGTSVYGLPDPPAGATRRADCQENGGAIAPGDADEQAWCAGELAVRWDAGPLVPAVQRSGFCAVADVLGADRDAPTGPQNPLDGTPEVILIAEGRLLIFDGPTGALRPHPAFAGNVGGGGGTPTVDDFDGDGYPEIGSAFASLYVVFDLQPPTPACPDWAGALSDGMPAPEDNLPRDPGGDCAADDDCAAGAVCGEGRRCVCLHNAWQRVTEDDSSRVTGSTVFDFNGDGAAEVAYHDECFFRIYDGRTGDVLLKEPSHSRTRTENPVVADIDNDGNAEIAFTVNNDVPFCSQGGGQNNGLEVWGDAHDHWVSARRVWHQHAYHITEVTESGAVPLIEPHGWSDLNGRRYNVYRSQPRSDLIAPDLTVHTVQFEDPGQPCDALSGILDLSATIASVGNLRIGPGVAVVFEGTWDGMRRPLTGPDGDAIVVELQVSLEPGDTTRVSARYDIADNGDDPDRLPDRVDVIVDAIGDPAFGRERECREDNNRAGVAIVCAMPRAF